MNDRKHISLRSAAGWCQPAGRTIATPGACHSQAFARPHARHVAAADARLRLHGRSGRSCGLVCLRHRPLRSSHFVLALRPPSSRVVFVARPLRLPPRLPRPLVLVFLVSSIRPRRIVVFVRLPPSYVVFVVVVFVGLGGRLASAVGLGDASGCCGGPASAAAGRAGSCCCGGVGGRLSGAGAWPLIASQSSTLIRTSRACEPL